MSEAVGAEKVQELIDAVPKEWAVWLNLYREAPKPAAPMAGRVEFDRDQPWFDQVRDWLIEHKYSDWIKIHVSVTIPSGRIKKKEQPGYNGKWGGAIVDFALPKIEPPPAPPPPVAERQPNPAAPPADPMELYRKGHEAYVEMGRMYGEKCDDCGKWVEECECEEPCCEECGLEESECQCNHEPSLGEALAKKFLIGEEGKEGLADQLCDRTLELIDAGADRLRFGAKGPPAPTRGPVKLTAVRTSAPAAQTAPVTPKTGGT